MSLNPSSGRFYKGRDYNPQIRGQKDTFVKPEQETLRPKTSLDLLTEVAVAINPAAQAILGLEAKQAIKEEKKKGFELAVRENRKEGGFKTVVDELRKNESDGVTNRFIGGSFFAQDAFNESRATLLGQRISRELQTLYATSTGKKPVTTTDGLPVLDENQEQLFEDRPLFEFDKNTDAYRNFAQNVSAIGQYESEGLDPEDALKYLEAKEKAFQKIEENHLKLNKDFKFNNLTSMNNAFLMQAWVTSKDSDLTSPKWDSFATETEGVEALTNSYGLINKKINIDFQTGLTSDKTTKYYDNLIKNVESVALQINQKFGKDEAFGFLDWAEKIQYGNGNNTLLQHKDFAMKKFNLKVKISKEIDRVNEAKDKGREDEARKKVTALIDKALEKSDDGRLYFMTEEGQQLFNALYEISPEYKDIIDNHVDLYNGDRKQTLIEFQLAINSGEYDDDPNAAGTDFLGIISKLGGYGRLTKLERSLVNSITKDIKGIPDNQLYGGYKYYTSQIKNRVFNYLKLTETDTGAIVSLKDISGRNEDANPFNLDGKQANIIGQKVIREAQQKLNNWRKSQDKPPTEEQVSDYFDNTILPEINNLLIKAINPEDITFDLYARDNSTYTVTLNRFQDAQLFKDFQEGKFSPINPPPELFKIKNIPQKFYQQYYNDTNPVTEQGLSTFSPDPKTQTEFNKGKNLNEIIKNKDKETNKKIDQVSSLPVNEQKSSLFNGEVLLASTDLTGLGLGEANSTIDTRPINYTIQSGDNLSTIAERYDTTVDEIIKINPDITDPTLIYKDQQIKIPRNPVHQYFDFKSREVVKFPDHGGLARVIKDGESTNNYSVVNYGTTGQSETIQGLDTTSIGDIKEDLDTGKYYAVGAYQFKAATFAESMKAAGLGTADKFTADAQDRMFWARIMNSIRTRARDYILGRSDDLDGALEDIAQEFAAAPMANGKGFYDDDDKGNKANIDLELLKTAIKEARKSITGK